MSTLSDEFLTEVMAHPIPSSSGFSGRMDSLGSWAALTTPGPDVLSRCKDSRWLADEAVAMLARKSQLEELMGFGQRHSAALGICEHDVDRLIAENRIERRG